MSRTAVVIQTLKRALRAKGLTYSELARFLQMSEPSIKRLFSGKAQLTIDRLEKICELLETDMASVLGSSNIEAVKPKVTLAQEFELAKDVKRLVFFSSLKKGCSIEKTLSLYKISKKEAELYLKQLEELKLLERHPGNRVKILVDNTISWIEDGPIRKLYKEDLRDTYLKGDFKKENEFFNFITFHFSKESMKHIQRKVAKLIQELKELNQLDQSSKNDDKEPTTLLVANRQWLPHQVEELMK